MLKGMVAFVVVGVLAASPTASAANVPADVSKCQGCHGVAGDSVVPATPRLNGQHAEYIVARLKAFLDPGSEDPHATAVMWDVARTTGDDTVQQLATHYSQQRPMAPLAPSGGRLASIGAKLYANGNASEGIAACQSCHGADALGAGKRPRLAGQHRVYLKNQLERLRLTLRANDTMHPNTNSMSDQEIAALVAYLGSD